jgi:hypothetical protein
VDEPGHSIHRVLVTGPSGETSPASGTANLQPGCTFRIINRVGGRDTCADFDKRPRGGASSSPWVLSAVESPFGAIDRRGEWALKRDGCGLDGVSMLDFTPGIVAIHRR